MNFIKKIFSFLVIVSLFLVPITHSSAQTAPVLLATGTLIHAEGNATIYYIENGVKRPIDSEETFRKQGFQWVIKDMHPLDLLALPEGDIVTKESALEFPAQADVVPDLAPFAAKDIQLVNRDGRLKLLFTTMLWNRGKGPLDLFATSSIHEVESHFETAQRIILPNGSVRTKVVGDLFWHAVHKHFHFDDFATYVMEMVPPGVTSIPGTRLAAEPSLFEALPPMSSVLGVSTEAPEIRNKSTFCLFETEQIALFTEGVKNPKKTYISCGKYRQGISVGWADRYSYTLPDQNFDVTDLPAGIYRLAFVLDPLQKFMEGSRGNNSSVTFVDLNPTAGTMTVLASGSPFLTPENQYPNGMLVRSERNPAIYVMQNNKKQLLRAETMGQVFVLPQGVLDAIPALSLIQAAGSPTIYLLNDFGFRRGIPSMEVFNSYGLKLEDVAVINQFDLPNYPETNLIKKQGDPTVYALDTRKSVGSLESLATLGLNPASVHTLNQTEFELYMVDVVATGLFVPWDVAFLPGGDMLVPERSGTLRRLGNTPGVMTVPSVLSTGEGGLMGVALHPKFAENNLIYIYYTTSDSGQKNRVVRFRLNGTELTEQTIIIDNIPSAIYHDGGRIAFGPDGMLYITTGDANSANSAQDLGSLAGKTLRLTAEGEIPADNPFGTAVWSYGHRNSQGIAWDNLGRMWQTEHGRSGASTGYDELNLVERGKNYGWPVIQGSETRTGMITPVFNSGPYETWAPAGIAFVNGSLYFGGLLGSSLYQVRFTDNGSVRDFRAHFKGKFGRLRAVVPGLDGSLYVTTSNRDGRGTVRTGDDKILRIVPGLLQSF